MLERFVDTAGVPALKSHPELELTLKVQVESQFLTTSGAVEQCLASECSIIRDDRCLNNKDITRTLNFTGRKRTYRKEQEELLVNILLIL